ncbi:hypothetical protein BYT27DRAFT_7192404 [Phlegmacium glaucopus]|nr:hypothetical protein BYT27DRAFT_7192404 [Phlegmacium glaucopus]
MYRPLVLVCTFVKSSKINAALFPHLSANRTEVLSFSQIFNLTRLRNLILPEQPGCWSTRREADSQPVRVDILLNNLQNLPLHLLK